MKIKTFDIGDELYVIAPNEKGKHHVAFKSPIIEIFLEVYCSKRRNNKMLKYKFKDNGIHYDYNCFKSKEDAIKKCVKLKKEHKEYIKGMIWELENI